MVGSEKSQYFDSFRSRVTDMLEDLLILVLKKACQMKGYLNDYKTITDFCCAVSATLQYVKLDSSVCIHVGAVSA
jgi:hypothetical protein